MSDRIIALAGNPNVGKSTVFNALTGMHQHTGNWPGKTVSNARGEYTFAGERYVLVDIPGTYSLLPSSRDEEIARDFICSGDADAIIVVADATCLERNLNLALQIIETGKPVVLCVNLLDEARKKGIKVDLDKLAVLLGVPVVGAAARSGRGLTNLKSAVSQLDFSAASVKTATYDDISPFITRAESIAKAVVSQEISAHRRDRRFDAFFTSRLYGIPVMLALLAFIFWLTIVGANYPSAILSGFFSRLEHYLSDILLSIGISDFWHGLLIDGVCRTLFSVVAVMLPPMAIFFPLFTILEDSGYLPRIAFNLDRFFKCAGAHGKQSLTMCMGFGCNACGVMGCRIIDSPRERLIACLTNNFVPCNGRFPTLIAIISMFFVSQAPGSSFFAALILLAVIVLGILMTLLVSKLLSKTLLRGTPSSFVLELPPYRTPQFGKVIVRSIFDRTLFVLGRAVSVAAPAGALIWLLANICISGTSLLAHCTGFLDPFARILGLDGVILMAFILGFPANEIVFPIIIMGYLSTGALAEMSGLSTLYPLLLQNGWTPVTAICTMLFSLMHFPCATTCLTIKKETGSAKWTFLSIALPTLCGIIVCALVANIARIFM